MQRWSTFVLFCLLTILLTGSAAALCTGNPRPILCLNFEALCVNDADAQSSCTYEAELFYDDCMDECERDCWFDWTLEACRQSCGENLDQDYITCNSCDCPVEWGDSDGDGVTDPPPECVINSGSWCPPECAGCVRPVF